MRRRLITGVAAAGALAAGLSGPAAARADNASQQVQATIVGPSGSTSSASVGQLEASCPVYAGPSYDPNGAFPAGSTWSVGPLLKCLSPVIPFTAGTSVIVGSTQLSYADLNTPSDFADRTETPVIWSDGNNLRFERPSRGSGDDPTADSEVASGGAPLSLTVFTGPALTVTATPSATTVAPGGSISFTATVSGGSASDFAWDFSGGANDSAVQNPTVTFPAGDGAGSYKVTVQASNPSTGAAGVGTTTVTVAGTPAPAATTTTATTTAPPPPTTSATTTTPAPTRGGRGSATGTRHHGGSGTSHPRRPAKSRRHRTTTTTSPHTTTTATSTTQSSATSPAARAPTTRTPTPARRRRPRHTHTPDRRTPAPRGGTLVNGRLLADVHPVPLAESPLSDPTPASPAGAAASIAHTAPLTWPALVGALAVLAGLLGAGALRELRGGAKR